MSEEFKARDWQDRFIREYQTNSKLNFLLEACTSSGKTAAGLYCYISLKDGLDWRFVVIVVSTEHLRKQYAQDAGLLFGLQLYYSGKDTRLGRIPAPQELLKEGYQGMVISYQWLTRLDNADFIRNSLEQDLARKTFIILDEVHHASSDLAFGKACETAFPEGVVSHRGQDLWNTFPFR